MRYPSKEFFFLINIIPADNKFSNSRTRRNQGYNR